MRTFLQEPLLESLEVLALNYLGNRQPLREIDELHRRHRQGPGLRQPARRADRCRTGPSGLAAEPLFDHFRGDHDLHRSLPGGDAAAGIRKATSKSSSRSSARRAACAARLAPPAPPASCLRGGRLPDSPRSYRVRRPFHWRSSATWRSTRSSRWWCATAVPPLLTPDSWWSFPRPTAARIATSRSATSACRWRGGTATRGCVRGVAGAARWPWFALGDLGLGEPGRAPVRFHLIGVVQDFRLNEARPSGSGRVFRPNRYGNGVLLLFNRPPTREAAEGASSYRIHSTFTGLDTGGAPAAGDVVKSADAAFWQADRRVVAIRLTTPLSALVDPPRVCRWRSPTRPRSTASRWRTTRARPSGGLPHPRSSRHHSMSVAWSADACFVEMARRSRLPRCV